MAIDDAPLNDLPLTNPIDTSSVDPLGVLMATPMRKLDADEYTANDLDGVTESATGSGNLNFLMMQAGQTNEAIDTLNPFNAQGNKGPSNASFANSVTYADGDEVYTTSMDRPSGYEAPADTQTLFDSGGSSVLATSNFNNSGSNAFADSAPSSSASAVTPANSTSGTNGLNGLNGNNGFSGVDGQDGNGGGGDGDIIIINNNNNQTTVINNNTTVYEGSTTNIYDTVNNVTNNVTNIVDSTTTNIFDTVNNVTNNLTTILDGTTTNLFDTINNVTNNVFDTVNNLTTNILDHVTNLFDTVNHITTNLTEILNNAVNNITDILTNITDIFNGGGDGGLPILGPIGLNLDATLDGVTNLSLDILNGNTITNILNETLGTDQILTPVTDLLGNLMSSTSLGILVNPFQPDNSADDVDLHLGLDLNLLGLQLPAIALDIPLDPVEALIGDIDISLDLNNALLDGIPVVSDLLGGLLGNGGGTGDTDAAIGGLGGLLNAGVVNGVAETILNPVEDLLGDIDIGGAVGLGLLGLDSGQTGPDTDISIPLNIGILDNTVLGGDALHISLDPLENIIGDVDLDLGVATNLLGDVAAPLFDTIAGGTGGDTILSGLGDAVSGLAGGLLSTNDAAGDTDLAIETGIGLLDHGLLGNALDVALNPVENILGDIDIGAAIGLDLLGGADASATDTDISIPLDIAFIDNPLPIDGIHIPLDPIEALIGDVDIDLSIAANLLGDVAGGLIDTAAGGSGTDGILPSIGNALTDIASGDLDSGVGELLGGLFDVLEFTMDNAISIVDAAPTSTGGLDLDALTGGLTNGLTDMLGGGDTGSWAETILPNAGDLLGGGLLDSITGGSLLSGLPDPAAGAPSISLPEIPFLPSIPLLGGGSGGGGLFGGGGGGLFG